MPPVEFCRGTRPRNAAKWRPDRKTEASGSPVDRRDPQHRILGIALQLAAYPPLRKHEHAYEARVPWRLITELREALGDAGVDWRAVHATLRQGDA